MSLISQYSDANIPDRETTEEFTYDEYYAKNGIMPTLEQVPRLKPSKKEIEKRDKKEKEERKKREREKRERRERREKKRRDRSERKEKEKKTKNGKKTKKEKEKEKENDSLGQLHLENRISKTATFPRRKQLVIAQEFSP